MTQQRLKDVLLLSADLLGINATLRALNRNKLLILCYHSILPAQRACGECNATVSFSQFRWQLETIRKLFVPVTPETVSGWVEGRNSLPKRAVLLTIDDGFLNSRAYAVPEFLRLEIPAVLSVMTGFVETGRFLWTHRLRQSILHWPYNSFPGPGGDGDVPLPWEHTRRCRSAQGIVDTCKSLSEGVLNEYMGVITKEIPDSAFGHLEEAHTFLTWEDIRDLHGQGFKIASHGVEHISFSGLPKSRLDQELRASKQAIETQLDAACDWITYPFGSQAHVSDAVVSEAREAGYRYGLTLFGTGNADPSEPLLLDRVCIDGLDGEVGFLGTLSGLSLLVSRSKTAILGDGHGSS